jgi:hypothetical protein
MELVEGPMAVSEGGCVSLSGRREPRRIPTRPARRGLLVEVASGTFVGEVVACDHREVTLRDRRGRARRFELLPGAFLVDDVPVTLVPPDHATPAPAAPRTTASGSLAPDARPAQVARASRILVEGIHDAELIETVWGDDLRAEGIVVEPLHGADDLVEVVRAFEPGDQRRLGILLDHLRPGTKEMRLAEQVTGEHVLVVGHPFVDVWAAVRPEVVGLDAWPQVPLGEVWKDGVARRLGAADRHELWQRIRAAVRSWRDLDRSLIRAVEQLIDFVTVPDATDDR